MLFNPFPSRIRVAGVLLAVLPVVSLAVDPTDNPVAAYYAGDPHAADYAWVDDLAWESVYNVLAYGAVADGNDLGDGVGVTDNLPAFQAAIDAAYDGGGGVVYVPAGSYYLSNHLYLRAGVILRGETPVQTNAQTDDFAPPTKLEFPRYFFDPLANGGAGNLNSSAFKFIYADNNSYAANMGLVWLDINRAGISMSADGDGTHNRLVFGTRTNNVASPDPGVPQLTREVDGIPQPFQEAWQRFSYRFVRNIHVYGQRNVLVANNRANDKHYTVDHQLPGWESVTIDDFLQVGYVIQDTKKVFSNDGTAFVALQAIHNPIFKYTNHYGIYVRGGSGDVWGAAPFENPGLFRTGITVRDNWVYTTMRVGYHLSGWGLKALNNVKRDLPNKVWWLHPTGLYSLSGAQTLENRGLDVGGSNILIDGNDLEVERHRVNNGGYFSTDGEGILVQECCGGTTLDDIVITNNSVNAYIGLYKMPYTRNIRIANNTLDSNYTSPAYVMVNANKNGTQAPVFDITVEDNTFLTGGNILVEGLSGGGGIFIRDNTMNGGKIKYPDGLTSLAGNTGYGSLEPVTVGAVRDYPVLELEDPTSGGILAPGETTLRARVTGSYLNPTPLDESELPEISTVEIYVDAVLLESFTAGTFDLATSSWLYETTWNPALGYYQLSAKAVPVGYSGPYTSTEWFTVSDMIPVRVREGLPGDLIADWRGLHFPSQTDPLIIGDDADVDLDGLPNLMEFFLGSDPNTPDPAAAPAVIQGTESVILRFRMRDDLGDNVHYKVLSSSNLQDWSEVPKTSLSGVSTGGSLPPGVSLYEYVLPSSPASPTLLKLQVSHQP